MTGISRRLRLVGQLAIAGGGLLLLPAMARADTGAGRGDYGGLLHNNPFEPEKKPLPPPPPKPGVKIRLWGYVVDNGKFSFNLNESLSGRTAWVAVGGSAGPFWVKNFDAVTGQLSVEYEGAVHQLQVRLRPAIAPRPQAVAQH